jgi:hypothetical protein
MAPDSSYDSTILFDHKNLALHY